MCKKKNGVAHNPATTALDDNSRVALKTTRLRTHLFYGLIMIKRIISAAIFATLASSAGAATPGAFYAGIDGGSTKVDNLQGDKGSYGAFLGYHLSDNFAAEIGARRLGNWDLGSEPDVDQYAASIIGTLPLANDFSIFGRLGYNKVKAKATYGVFNGDHDDNGVLYGVGAGYQMTPAISGRIEFQKPSSDSQNISVGIAYAF